MTLGKKKKQLGLKILDREERERKGTLLSRCHREKEERFIVRLGDGKGINSIREK